ncbi:hypothetical protein BURPS406E_R0031 [Burkholderia pseudomallei 406e]|nr:hypothetical protein BURPS406E_R0031 [Burkholderia pseudomallei 406e]
MRRIIRADDARRGRGGAVPARTSASTRAGRDVLDMLDRFCGGMAGR